MPGGKSALNFDRIAEPPRPCCWPQGAPLEDLGTNFCPSFRRALKPVWELCNALISGKLGVHLGSPAPLFRSTRQQFFFFFIFGFVPDVVGGTTYDHHFPVLPGYDDARHILPCSSILPSSLSSAFLSGLMFHRRRDRAGVGGVHAGRACMA